MKTDQEFGMLDGAIQFTRKSSARELLGCSNMAIVSLT